jgi:hypothetical protein
MNTATERNWLMKAAVKKVAKLFAAGLITALVVLCGLVGLALWSHSSSPVDLSKVYMVSQASSTHEVEELLGKPDRIGKRTDDGSLTWTYGHPLKWYEFRVDFASDGQVLRCVFQD